MCVRASRFLKLRMSANGKIASLCFPPANQLKRKAIYMHESTYIHDSIHMHYSVQIDVSIHIHDTKYLHDSTHIRDSSSKKCAKEQELGYIHIYIYIYTYWIHERKAKEL